MREMSLWNALRLDMREHRAVTLVGGGGKTTTMYYLAQEARAAGKRVIVTTSTHIMPHPRLFLTDDPSPDNLRACLDAHGIITLGTLGRADKLCGTGEIGVCKEAADIVLIEGDGARIRPLKVPAEHEPVIPPETDAVIAIAGMDALDEPIGVICHRPERTAAFLGKRLEDPVTEEDVVKILSSPEGSRKNVAPSMAYRCLLNKTDDPVLRERAGIIAAGLDRLGIFTLIQHYEEKERGGLCWF